MARVSRILRVALVVRDLASACGFYRDALAFTPKGEPAEVGEGASRRRVQALTLGAQSIELAAFVDPGAPYPEPRSANDPWFQHFAIPVGDMDAAYARLSAHAQQAISRGGPQRLPPSTGSVTAYKFRDPDGHPLELSLIPHSAWSRLAEREPGAIFLGVDHSAIAVADLDASLAFYTGVLGMTLRGRGVNTGPEQDRLDGLEGVQVDIVVVQPAGGGPHIELLHYRSPRPAPSRTPPAVNAIAATRRVLEVEDIDAVRAALAGARVRPVAADPTGLLVRDPDGHLLDLRPA